MEIRPVEAELFHVDRWPDKRTDMTKLIGSFCTVANMHENGFGDVSFIELAKIK